MTTITHIVNEKGSPKGESFSCHRGSASSAKCMYCMKEIMGGKDSYKPSITVRLALTNNIHILIEFVNRFFENNSKKPRKITKKWPERNAGLEENRVR